MKPLPTCLDVSSDAALAHSASELREHAREACALLKALANEDRLLLLCGMSAGRRNVSELEAATGIRQPTLSQQLAVLRQEGLARTEKEGKFVYYALDNPQAMRLMETLWEIYCAPQAARP